MSEAKPGLKAVLVHEASVLLQQGIEAVSLRRVAMAAGVSPMAPYRHFPDKAALLGAVAEQGFEALRLRLEAADRTAQGRSALIAQGVAYVVFAREQPALYRLMFATPEQACVPVDATVGAYGVLARRVASVYPQDPAAMATGCWSLVHGLATLSMDQAVRLETEGVHAVLSAMIPTAAELQPPGRAG